MSLIALAFLWTGSQIPAYIFGTSVFLDTPIVLIVFQVLSLPTFIVTSEGSTAMSGLFWLISLHSLPYALLWAPFPI